MEIYAASKREQSAPVKQKAGTVQKSGASPSSSAQAAQIEQFQRNREALSLIEEQAREAEEKFRQAAARRLAEPEEQTEGSDEFKAMAEYLKIMQRCREIARRLINGDRVPPEDEQYLLTNDPDGYKTAMAARRPNRNPREWESVLPDVEGAETTESTAAEGTAGEVRSPFAGGRDSGGGQGGESGEGGEDAAGG